MADPDGDENVLAALRDLGIAAIVSLTKRKLPDNVLKKFGFEYLQGMGRKPTTSVVG